MEWIYNIFVFIIGAAMGSFLNCLAGRLYHRQPLGGRSACPHCGRKIAWYDNIPLISFINLRGVCRQCHKKISWQYPLVELAVGALFIIAWRHNLVGVNVWNLGLWDLRFVLRDWLAIGILTVIFIMDWRWYVVDDVVSLPAIVLLALANLLLGSPWGSLLSAAVIGAGFFTLQYVISRGRWVGGGDIRLGALLGVALGWPLTLVALMLAYVGGAVVGVFLIIFKKKQLKSQVPFGVFLAPATLVALWWGTAIYQWYLNLLF